MVEAPGKTIPEGYNVSFSSTMAGDRDHLLICDVCHRRVWHTHRLERNYPEDPDIHVCWQCIEERGLLK